MLQISGIASHFAPQIQANAMQRHFRIALIAMQNNTRVIALSSANLLLTFGSDWRLDKNHIVFVSPLAGNMPVLHSHCGLLVAVGCAVWSGALATHCLQMNKRTMAPSAEIEQNKCVGVAIATFDVWKRTMDRNNQSGRLHNLWPTNYVVNRTVWWTQIWSVDR